MSTVSEIENAVQKLSPGDLRAFRDWFLGLDAAAGRLDALADEAIGNRLSDCGMTSAAWMRTSH